MKVLFILFSLLGSLFIREGFSQRVIERPAYEFRNTGIYRVEKIELSDQSTRIKFLSEFIPGWWVQFTQQELYLENPETGQKYQALEAEGIQWGQQKTTPKTGTDTFWFTFPPLPSDIQKINLISGSSGIYGLYLKGEKPVFSDFPAGFIGNWYDAQGKWQYSIFENFVIYNNKFWNYTKTQVKGKTVTLNLKNGNEQLKLKCTLQKNGQCKLVTDHKNSAIYSSAPATKFRQSADTNSTGSFFKPGSKAVIQGYIRGYTPQAGFTSGLIYHCNTVTTEDLPTVVTIHPDGRFETVLNLDFPAMNTINFNRNRLSFYVTPGDTLTMFIEWEDFLKSDRYRNQLHHDFRTLDFMGKTAQLNREIVFGENRLFSARSPRIPPLVKKLTPDQFLKQQTALYKKQSDTLNKLSASYHFPEEAQRILQGKLFAGTGINLLDFVMYRKNERPDPANKALNTPIDPSYFSFLKQADLNDIYLLPDYSFRFFINRMEYESPLHDAQKVRFKQPSVKLEEYALKNFKGLTSSDRELLNYFLQPIVFQTDEDVDKWRKQKKELAVLLEKNKDEVQNYTTKYIDPLPSYTALQETLLEWQQKDNILKNVLGLDHNLVYEIIKFHDAISILHGLSEAETDTLRQAIHITHPYVREQLDKAIDKTLHPVKAYTLPDTKGAAIFRKIVEPYKGKIVFVDFWATSCGPCRSGIKNMKPIREKYKDKEVAFVFITDEKSSPIEAYESFMKDVEGYKYRITESDYNYLRELFRFNGIPRYVILDRNGDVLYDNFNGHLETELEKLL